MPFYKDLQFGKIYENKANEYIDYDEIKIINEKCKEYDLIITKNNINFKYEIKADRRAYYTNNMVIEYECRGRKSGIEATTADYWLYFVIINSNNDIVYNIPVKELKEIIKNCKTVSGGDNFSSKMYIVKLDNIIKYKIDKITKDNEDSNN